ncbi:hypothetical protein RM717_33815 [Streptomyces griseus]|uniref:DUF2273 domain-containing protein n=2 Tax=Streptomycetaceae TaxID=2062 RepID=A0ABU2WC48_9ACTN|nr:hypothetical protein [Streptomyces griseus]ARF76873.1 hypothetical protein B7C62_34725 [Kitasatospora albolonga]MDT0495468.1 hypothetical protein [Streptomyces griseus]MDT0524328.1 hypothetical protein [Streptomyces sp. DSM 41633]
MTSRVEGPGPADGVPGRGVLGAAAGMALGFAGWFGGFGAFLVVGALGALGWFAGRLVDEGTGLQEFLDSLAGRRR